LNSLIERGAKTADRTKSPEGAGGVPGYLARQST
jgi:hypothetical protein